MGSIDMFWWKQEGYIKVLKLCLVLPTHLYCVTVKNIAIWQEFVASVGSSFPLWETVSVKRKDLCVLIWRVTGEMVPTCHLE